MFCKCVECWIDGQTNGRTDGRTDGQRDDLDNKMAACLVGQRYKDQTAMRVDKWMEKSGLLSACMVTGWIDVSKGKRSDGSLKTANIFYAITDIRSKWCLLNGWLKKIFLALLLIRSTTQICILTCHQYGISALVSQTSFRRNTSGSVAKCELFSRASWMDV